MTRHHRSVASGGASLHTTSCTVYEAVPNVTWLVFCVSPRSGDKIRQVVVVRSLILSVVCLPVSPPGRAYFQDVSTCFGDGAARCAGPVSTVVSTDRSCLPPAIT